VLPGDSCRHSWCSKDNQQVLPALDARPSEDSIYKFAGVCRRCRIHLEVEVNYTLRGESDPCPNATYPLHHLVHSPVREGVAKNEMISGKSEASIETYAFECSALTCPAVVLVRYTPPLLSDEHVRLLTDKVLLTRRTREVIESDPTRFEGHKPPTPADVLSDLRSYLKNSLEHQEPRPIKVDNKRFTLRFGIDGRSCINVLNFIGFKYEVRHLIPVLN
jgi:ubiquitin carboxyl-terminal hydrolase 25